MLLATCTILQSTFQRFALISSIYWTSAGLNQLYASEFFSQVTSYIAVFLVELFIDESDLFWLLEFESVFEEENEDAWQVWKSLIADTLNILKLRRNEEAVQHLFKQTKGADRFPIEVIV